MSMSIWLQLIWKIRGNRLAVGYVRPHDVTIEREGTDTEAVQATIVHIHVVGRAVQVELKRQDNDQFLEAELTKERYRELTSASG